MEESTHVLVGQASGKVSVLRHGGEELGRGAAGYRRHAVAGQGVDGRAVTVSDHHLHQLQVVQVPVCRA